MDVDEVERELQPAKVGKDKKEKEKDSPKIMKKEKEKKDKDKVTIKGAKQAVQMFGPAQHGVAMAVADSVAEGVIPADEADDLFICVGVFIHWEAADDAKIQQYNYQATMESIERAVKGTPTASEVVQKAKTTKHPFQAAGT